MDCARGGPHLHTTGIAYYWAKHVWPDQTASEADAVVRQALLDLLDEDLVFFYWGWDNGCDLDPAKARRASRAEVEEELRRGGDAPPKTETVWLTTTDEGIERLESLPATVFLRYEPRQEIECVRRDHPEYFEQCEQYFREVERWVETGEGSNGRKHPIGRTDLTAALGVNPSARSRGFAAA